MKKRSWLTMTLASSMALAAIAPNVAAAAPKHSLQTELTQFAQYATKTEQAWKKLFFLTAKTSDIGTLTTNYKKVMSLSTHLKTHKLTKQQQAKVRLSEQKVKRLQKEVTALIALQPKLAAAQKVATNVIQATALNEQATKEAVAQWEASSASLLKGQSTTIQGIVQRVMANEVTAEQVALIMKVEQATASTLTEERVKAVAQLVESLPASAYKTAKQQWLTVNQPVVYAQSTTEAAPTVVDYKGSKRADVVIDSKVNQYITVRNVTVTGTLTVRGGGNVTLENVNAEQRIVVEDVAENSLHFIRVTAKQVDVKDPNTARLVIDKQSTISAMNVQSNVTLEANEATTIETITVTGQAASLMAKGTLTVPKLTIDAAKGFVQVGEGVNVNEVQTTGADVQVKALDKGNVGTILAGGKKLSLDGKLKETKVVVQSAETTVTIEKTAEVKEVTKAQTVPGKVNVINNGKVDKIDGVTTAGNETVQTSGNELFYAAEFKVTNASVTGQIVAIPYSKNRGFNISPQVLRQFTKIRLRDEVYELPAATVIEVKEQQILFKLPINWTGEFKLQLPSRLDSNGSVVTSEETNPLIGVSTVIVTKSLSVSSNGAPIIIVGDALVERTAFHVANIVVKGNLTVDNYATTLERVTVEGDTVALQENESVENWQALTVVKEGIKLEGMNKIVIPFDAQAHYTFDEKIIREQVMLVYRDTQYSLPKESKIVRRANEIVIELPLALLGETTIQVPYRVWSNGTIHSATRVKIGKGAERLTLSENTVLEGMMVINGDVTVAPTVERIENIIVLGDLFIQSEQTIMENVIVEGNTVIITP